MHTYIWGIMRYLSCSAGDECAYDNLDKPILADIDDIMHTLRCLIEFSLDRLIILCLQQSGIANAWARK